MHVTKDGRMLFLITTAGIAASWAVSEGFQAFTAQASEQTRKEMEELKKRDPEVRRYAEHSKRALQSLFDTVQRDASNSATNRAADNSATSFDNQPVKIPQVAWHPKAVSRDQKKQQENN